MKIVALVAGAALFVGCGGGSDAPASCVAQTGTYQLAITPSTPNGCGLSAGSIVVPAGTVPFANDTCNAQVTTSANLCDTDVSSTCPGDTGTSQITGHIEWNAAGTHATGILTYAFAVAGSTTPCVSTVDLTYSQL